MCVCCVVREKGRVDPAAVKVSGVVLWILKKRSITSTARTPSISRVEFGGVVVVAVPWSFKLSSVAVAEEGI